MYWQTEKNIVLCFLIGNEGAEMEAKIIGNRIEKLIELEGINKKELAQNLNITTLELEKKLNGEEEFYIAQMMKIKEIFNLNLEVFTKLFFENDFKLEEFISN